jgi:hypothetical protein
LPRSALPSPSSAEVLGGEPDAPQRVVAHDADEHPVARQGGLAVHLGPLRPRQVAGARLVFAAAAERHGRGDGDRRTHQQRRNAH